MKPHANARLSLNGRELLVYQLLSEGWSLAQIAEAGRAAVVLRGPPACSPTAPDR